MNPTERRKDLEDTFRALSYFRSVDRVPVEVVTELNKAVAEDFAPQAINMALTSFVFRYRADHVDGPAAYFRKCVKKQQVRIWGKPRQEVDHGDR